MSRMSGPGRSFTLGQRARALGFYAGVLVIAYLAAAYLGGFFVVLAVTLLLIPILSFAALQAAAAAVGYGQRFSSAHPVKGERIVYSLRIENRSVIPVSQLHVEFKAVRPLGETVLPDLSIYLGGSAVIDRDYPIRLPYRGIYTIGIRRVTLRDPLRLFAVRPQVGFREFQVFPRVLKLSRLAAGDQAHPHAGRRESMIGEPDYAMFTQLREARHGEAARHIAWRKFAAVGKPFVRQYQASSEPAVTIYVDLRMPPAEAAGAPVLAVEDVTIEALLAVVRYFLSTGVPTAVRAAVGQQVYAFAGRHLDEFDRLYRENFRLAFKDSVSPARLFWADWEARADDAESVMFLTHHLDPELFTIIEASVSSKQVTGVIFNGTGRGPGALHDAEQYFNTVRNRGGRVMLLRGPDTIEEDLAGGGVRAAAAAALRRSA